MMQPPPAPPQIAEEIPTNQRTDFRQNRLPVPRISVPGPKQAFLMVAQ